MSAEWKAKREVTTNVRGKSSLFASGKRDEPQTEEKKPNTMHPGRPNVNTPSVQWVIVNAWDVILNMSRPERKWAHTISIDLNWCPFDDSPYEGEGAMQGWKQCQWGGGSSCIDSWGTSESIRDVSANMTNGANLGIPDAGWPLQ
ncbi:hypothetical protein PISMIDRAFT_24223 [Pisolithus microcarpus 441]|uniref:Uncharacterized protein n=1 Tax=Pisolithus microcarpus 441 TaxID=765257 RepID=A0A0C9Z1X9_9AGAM|nr:hypothetical protein PISMIDRAFT_24223 [Pisolithus microcarpus 441]